MTLAFPCKYRCIFLQVSLHIPASIVVYSCKYRCIFLQVSLTRRAIFVQVSLHVPVSFGGAFRVAGLRTSTGSGSGSGLVPPRK